MSKTHRKHRARPPKPSQVKKDLIRQALARQEMERKNEYPEPEAPTFKPMG